MKKNFTAMLPYLLVLAADFYLLPLLMRDTGGAMVMMLCVMPVIAFVCGMRGILCAPASGGAGPVRSDGLYPLQRHGLGICAGLCRNRTRWDGRRADILPKTVDKGSPAISARV